MAIRNRMPPWHENFSLPNGRTLLLRPIRPEDGPPLQGAFSLLGPEEIRARFVRSSAEITPKWCNASPTPTPRARSCWWRPSSCRPAKRWWAPSHAALVPGTRQAEYTILVSSFVAGQGLGRQLMRKLVKWARRKYLDCLYGDVLQSNLPMLQLAESLGFKPQPHPDSPELVRMVLELDA